MVEEPQLQLGERAVRIAAAAGVTGVDLIVAERPASGNDKPLVVFLPGAVHLARIAYGLPGLHDEDFLAHWFVQAQHPFLGISYPPAVASQPVFASVDPTLGLAALAEGIAGTVTDTVDRLGLPREVIVAGWSAAGNIAPLLQRALSGFGIDLLCFAALAATPPLPNLVLGSATAAERFATDADSFTADGLLSFRAIRSFTGELGELNRSGDHQVLPVERYLAEMVGDMPINLFPGLGAHHDGTSVHADHGRTLDAAGAAWADYPLVAAVQPDEISDARHALTDRSNWAMINNNVIYGRLLSGVDFNQLTSAQWQALVEVTDRVPDRLHRRIVGGHLFFVGSDGARAAAVATLELADQAKSLRTDIARIVGSVVE